MQGTTVRRGLKYRVLGWVGLCVAAAVGGCDAQAAPDYRGEALLSVNGSVEIPDAVDGPLEPALMFSQGSDFHLIDVSVQGEFPANFRFDVYDIPPPAMLTKSPDGVFSALGFITAVPTGTAGHFRSAMFASMSGSAPCYENCENHCEAIGRCETESQWCADDGECYREVVVCPRLDSPAAECTLEAEGDPQLKIEAFDRFAGFSKNYLVLYLDDELSADSYGARVAGASGGLSRGYHLLAVRGETDEEIKLRQACDRRAENLVAARINEKYGTDFSYDDIASSSCWLDIDCSDGFFCPEPEGRLCELAPDMQRAIESDLMRDLPQAEVELMCPPAGWVMTHVPNPERERITVRLSADANPLSHAGRLPAP